jgi:hypothetical protein
VTEDLDGDRKTYIEVLDWFCPNVGNRRLPIIKSAKMFREKFFQIKFIMEQLKRSPSIDFDEEVTLTKKAKKIVKALREIYWGSDFPGVLETSVQISLDQANLLWDILLDFKFKGVSRFIREFYMIAPTLFVRYWFDEEFDRYNHWLTRKPLWDGNPKLLTFHLSKPRVKETISSWVREYTGDWSKVQHLMELIDASGNGSRKGRENYPDRIYR